MASKQFKEGEIVVYIGTDPQRENIHVRNRKNKKIMR